MQPLTEQELQHLEHGVAKAVRVAPGVMQRVRGEIEMLALSAKLQAASPADYARLKRLTDLERKLRAVAGAN